MHLHSLHRWDFIFYANVCVNAMTESWRWKNCLEKTFLPHKFKFRKLNELFSLTSRLILHCLLWKQKRRRGIVATTLVLTSTHTKTAERTLEALTRVPSHQLPRLLLSVHENPPADQCERHHTDSDERQCSQEDESKVILEFYTICHWHCSVGHFARSFSMLF